MPLSNQNAPIMEECKHGITAAFCSWCKDKSKSRVQRAWDRQDADDFQWDSNDEGHEAAFDSNCPWCDDEITKGDIIFPRAGHWICGDCAMSYDMHPSNSPSPRSTTPNLPRSS